MKHWHYRRSTKHPMSHSHLGGHKFHWHASLGLRGYGRTRESLLRNWKWLSETRK